MRDGGLKRMRKVHNRWLKSRKNLENRALIWYTEGKNIDIRKERAMQEKRNIDRWGIGAICVALVMVVALLILQQGQPTATPQSKERVGVSADYADTLFDTTYVHTVNICIKENSWQYMV